MDQLNRIFSIIDLQKSLKCLFDQFNNDSENQPIILTKNCSAWIVFVSHMTSTSSKFYGHYPYDGQHRITATNLSIQHHDDYSLAILSKPIAIKLQFRSAEVCARIIGRNGLLVRDIRQRTGTIVESPKIIENRSTKTFEIEGKTVRGVLAAAVAIQQLGLYFYHQINELSCTLEKDEIRLDVDCNPYIVSCVLFGRGRLVIELAKQTSVRIISPKPYSNRCCFKLIGLPFDVIIACLKLRRLINDMVERYGYKIPKSGSVPAISPIDFGQYQLPSPTLTKPMAATSPGNYAKNLFLRHSPLSADNSISI